MGFHELTMRKDIAMVLITQNCADTIRHAVDAYTLSGQVIPAVLEIPSKDQPYDPRKDSIMQRVAFFMPQAMASWAWRRSEVHAIVRLPPGRHHLHRRRNVGSRGAVGI